MATSVIRRTLVAVLAVQPVCRGYGAETCSPEASPWAVSRNGSFQCGASIEDDLPDDQVALLQVVLKIGNNGTKHVAPITPLMQQGIQKSSFGRDVGISLPQTAVRSVRSQQAKTVASVAAGPFFIIGAVCVGALIVCMLIVNEVSDNSDHRTSKDRRQPKYPVPDVRSREGTHRITHESSGFGKPRDSHLPLRFVGASPVHEGYQQDLLSASAVPAVRHGTAPAAAVVMGQHQIPVVVGSAPSMGHQQTPAVVGSAAGMGHHHTHAVGSTGSVAPGVMRAPSSPQQLLRQLEELRSQSPPRGADLVSSERNLATRARDVFPGAGAPAICPSMILLNRGASLTIPMREIIAAAAGGAEKLEIFSAQGKAMLQAKVQFDEDGRKAFVISSVKGGLPRVQIKLRGPGEPFDVIGPKNDHYGTLVPTGDSNGILSHLNQPIMKINKVSNLDMTATTMNDSGIANAAPDGNNNWKLTVGQGADAVLICACMMSLILLGATRT